MTDENTPVDSGSGSENPVVKSNVNASEAALRRAEQLAERFRPDEGRETEESRDEVEAAQDEAGGSAEVEEPEEEVENSGQPEEEAEPEGESGEGLNEDVLSKIDLDGMSPEDIASLGKRLGSKAVERFAELTWRAKSAEEELAAAKSGKDPLASEEEATANPYSDLTTVKDLREKARELDALIELAEEISDESEGMDLDDVAGEIGGKEHTRREIKQILKESRKARNKYLPQQLERVNELEKAEETAKKLASRAKAEFPWLSDGKSETRKVFDALARDANLRKAYAADPQLGARLPYLLAHAANSMSKAEKAKQAKAPAKPPSRLEPNSSAPSRNAAPSSKAGRDSQSKAIDDLQSRYKRTGSIKDLVALRTAKLSQQL